MLNYVLALFLAVPSFGQVKLVPTLSAVPAPGVGLFQNSVHVPSAGLSQGIPSLSVSVLPAPAAPQAPSVSVPSALVPARTASVLREDADRLYVGLAAIHSQAKAGVKEAALADLKRAFLGDFDGVAQGLGVVETGDELRARIKDARAARSKAEKALAKAPAAARVEASKALAAVSGELAALQLKAARELLASKSPVGPRAMKRNAALWTLVGAHNSAAAAQIEAAYQESLAAGEEAFGDGRPYLYWTRWRSIRAELETAALDARNGRAEKAARDLAGLALVLRGTRDAADLKAAEAIEKLLPAPESGAILAVLPLAKHPSIKVRTAVAYEDVDASLRALVHALESSRADYLETAAAEASLRRAASLLSSRRPSPAEKRLAASLASAAHEWAARGRVDAKREAARNLDAASLALSRGDLELAARHAGWAADALSARREEIRRIALAVRGRLLRALGA